MQNTPVNEWRSNPALPLPSSLPLWMTPTPPISSNTKVLHFTKGSLQKKRKRNSFGAPLLVRRQ